MRRGQDLHEIRPGRLFDRPRRDALAAMAQQALEQYRHGEQHGVCRNELPVHRPGHQSIYRVRDTSQIAERADQRRMLAAPHADEEIHDQEGQRHGQCNTVRGDRAAPVVLHQPAMGEPGHGDYESVRIEFALEEQQHIRNFSR